MFSSLFWKAAFERSVKTFAQVLAVALAADGVNVLTLDWTQSLAFAATTALVSVLTSLASAPVGPDRSPSLVGESRAQL